MHVQIHFSGENIMRKRFVMAATTLAAVVPALAFGQARPAQRPPARPAAPPAQRPAAQPARPAASMMAAPHREGTFELSVGAGLMTLDKQLSSSAYGFGGFGRIGYNFTPMLGLSVGAGVGSVNSHTVIQPFADLTYTMDLNKKMSPFVLVGAGLTQVSANGSHITSTYGGHVGVGIRSMMNENMALRIEGRMQYDHFAEISSAAYNSAASVGLSWFMGGKKTVTAVAVTAPAATLAYAGATTRASATVEDQHGRPMTGKLVTWSSSNPSVARVDANGNVTAVGDGAAEITATSDGVRGSTRVTVARTVNSVTMMPTTGSINALGRTQQFTASGKDQGNQPVANAMFTWASSNPAVATVSSTGLATAVGTGTATITATANGKSASATLTVTQAVATVAVTPAMANVTAGATTQLSAAASDANNRPVSGKMFTWTSESPNIATVSTTGLVTGLTA
ncbi:MAG: Ig-like domain-containing protein, partial [Candidatus Krumholzibacteria bacterium]|nr:Ig-like domain-containing protein [Candidatus Krumholzibacteria bacterium]